jgi:hypothetical protein
MTQQHIGNLKLLFTLKSCLLKAHNYSKVACFHFTYVRTFHRLHLLRHWTPTILMSCLNFKMIERVFSLVLHKYESA